MIWGSERKELVELRDTVRSERDRLMQEVSLGRIELQIAEQRMADQFGHDWRASLEAVEERLESRLRVPALAILIAVPILLFVLGAGITGFGVLMDSTSTMTLNSAFTEDTTIVLSAPEEIHGVLVSGWYSGNGSAQILYRGSNGSAVIHAINLSPPSQAGTVVLNSPTRNRSFQYRCEQTCNFTSSGSHTAKLTIDGGTLFIESFTIITRETAELPAPENDSESETVDVETPDDTPPEQPASPPLNETPQNASDEQDPTTCNSDADCSAGVCVQSIYEGVSQQGFCAPSQAYCSLDSGAVTPGTTTGSSTCVGSSQGSAWIADTGRWVWQSAEGVTLAVADKYGSMAVRGTLFESSSTFDQGWHNAEQPTVSIDRSTGDVRIAGTVQERTTPLRDGIIVQDAQETAQVSIVPQGQIMLRGDFVSEVASLE